jgi:putative transposase
VIRSPVRTPKANAVAERWVGTIRRECLDHLLDLGRRHLEQVLKSYVRHYNTSRPHRSLDLASPEVREDPPPPVPQTAVVRRDVLGGLIHEYSRAAA